jgi:predicted metal-dependent hydrolase
VPFAKEPAAPAVAAQLPLWDDAAATPSVNVRHSRRARRIAVRIAATGQVELVVPRGVSEHRAWAFLRSQSEWIGRQVARRRALLPAPQAFPPRELRLALTGETWRLFQAGGRGRPRLLVQPHAGGGAGPKGGLLELRGTGTVEQWRRCLVAWLRRHALDELGRRLAEQARRHGLSYSAVKVRQQRTRWGSCSSRGVISLNVALLFQPPDVVRYLLCHELAHTRHMDHSQRFWRLVAQCEPRWRELDRALLSGWRHVPAFLRETT